MNNQLLQNVGIASQANEHQASPQLGRKYYWKQTPHVPHNFLLRVQNNFATFCDLALDPSAQAKARKGITLEPNDLPLTSDVFAMHSSLQVALAAASKNNSLGCFNATPLTYKLHCIKAPPKEDSKQGKKQKYSPTPINSTAKTDSPCSSNSQQTCAPRTLSKYERRTGHGETYGETRNTIKQNQRSGE
jgi:hypothetical protein